MRILVTGGTGFLGRHIVWRLAAAGHEVVFTGRNADAAKRVVEQRLAGFRAPRFVHITHGQTGAQAALEAASAGMQAVVHSAALSSPWGTRQAFLHANVEGTREVLAACRHHNIGTLVHISTPGLYFNFRDRLAVREDEALPPPANLYAQTKAVAEQLVRSAEYLDSAIILRPRAIFGPHDNTLLPRLLRVARSGSLPLMRSGRAWLDLSYVDNVVDAVELGLARSVAQPLKATCNISNGEPIQVRALFETLASVFDLNIRLRPVPYPAAALAAWCMEAMAHVRPGWEPPMTRYSVGLLAYSQTLDLSRAASELGYTPRIALAEGMARTAAWFATQETTA